MTGVEDDYVAIRTATVRVTCVGDDQEHLVAEDAITPGGCGELSGVVWAPGLGGGVGLPRRSALGGRFLNHGRPVADYLAAAFDELIRTEHLALSQPDPIGVRQVCVTHAGQLRYLELTSNGTRETHHADR